MEERYNEVFSEVFKVYDVFKGFFGEDYVDLQGIPSVENLNDSTSYADSCYDILVYWPSVTVSNEYDESISIQDLFAKVSVTLEGKIPLESPGFLLNRAKYSDAQFRSDYMHSHIARIPKGDLTEFQNPCLGKGPIANTVMTLKTDGDGLQWLLFCQELSAYVSVESVAGVPYKRISSVGGSRDIVKISYAEAQFLYLKKAFEDEFSIQAYKELLKTFLESGELKFIYKDGSFFLGLSPYEFVLRVSNIFIRLYNSKWRFEYPDARVGRLIGKYLLQNGKIHYLRARQQQPLDYYIGKYVCTFKGQQRLLQIYTDNTEHHEVRLLDPDFCSVIIMDIIKILNYRYRNNHGNTEQQNGEENARTYQNVLFL